MLAMTDVLGEKSAPAAPRGSAARAAVTAIAATIACQPLLHPSGPGNSSPVDVLVLISLMLTAVWAASSGQHLRFPYVPAASLLLLGGAIAGLAGTFAGISLLTLLQDAVLILWCISVVNTARLPGVLRLYAVVWAWSSIAWAGVLVLAATLGMEQLVGRNEQLGDRAMLTFGDPNYAALYWVISLFVIRAVKVPSQPWSRWAAYALVIWAVVLTASNGAWAAIVLGGVVLLAEAAYRHSGWLGTTAVLLFSCLVVLGGLTVLTPENVGRWARGSGVEVVAQSVGRLDSSAGQRSELVSETMRLYARNGPLGSGPATTQEELSAQQYPYPNEAHNDYIAALTERGLIGAFAVLALVLSAGWRAGRAMRAPPDRQDGPSIRAPINLVAALLAIGVGGLFYEVLHMRFVWVLLALLAVLSIKAESPVRDARTNVNGTVPGGTG